jgi:hypothetical protein
MRENHGQTELKAFSGDQPIQLLLDPLELLAHSDAKPEPGRMYLRFLLFLGPVVARALNALGRRLDGATIKDRGSRLRSITGSRLMPNRV